MRSQHPQSFDLSTGSALKPMKYTGWPALKALPISLSGLKPPMPGPWPARIDHDDRSFCMIDDRATWRHDAN